MDAFDKTISSEFTHLGLFEGIGGFSLAARLAGWHTPIMVEWDQYCQLVLSKNFPNAKIFGDIKQFDGRPYAGEIDIITGGFPCQPFSIAGKRSGTNDDRYLWPEMLRVISEIKPTWVVGENVADLISMDGGRVLDTILSDLENEGYSTEIYIIPAISVGAPHKRNRLWIIAHSNDCRGSYRFKKIQAEDEQVQQWNYNSKPCNTNINITPNSTSVGKRKQNNQKTTICSSGETWESFSRGNWGSHWLEVATRICRVDDGVPGWVDSIGIVPTKPKAKQAAGRSKRLKSLGNAIVPQIALQIFQAINMYYERND